MDTVRTLHSRTLIFTRVPPDPLPHGTPRLCELRPNHTSGLYSACAPREAPPQSPNSSSEMPSQWQSYTAPLRGTSLREGRTAQPSCQPGTHLMWKFCTLTFLYGAVFLWHHRRRPSLAEVSAGDTHQHCLTLSCHLGLRNLGKAQPLPTPAPSSDLHTQPETSPARGSMESGR